MSGPLAVKALSVYLGADAVRIHNVRETLDAIKIVEALKKAAQGFR